MDALIVARIALKPCLFSGEAKNGGKPGGQAVEQLRENGLRGSAGQRVRWIAIQRVFANIEVEGR